MQSSARGSCARISRRQACCKVSDGRSLKVPVKLCAFACVLACSTLTSALSMLYLPTLLSLIYVAMQGRTRLALSFAMTYAVLALLLFLIRFHGLHMIVFSEFHVLLLWSMSPVIVVGWDLVTTPPGDLSAFLSKMHAPVALILGVLVVFRFFPTMASELSNIVRSMRNRSLTAPARMIVHPAASGEYVIVPLMLRCLQIADQLTVSAIARGAERNGIRSSYYGRPCEARDAIWLAVWMAGTALFLLVIGAKP